MKSRSDGRGRVDRAGGRTLLFPEHHMREKAIQRVRGRDVELGTCRKARGKKADDSHSC